MSSSRNKTANWNCVCGTVERQREKKGMSASRQREIEGEREHRSGYTGNFHICASVITLIVH